MYRQIKQTDPMKSASCPKCGSSRLMLKSGKLICTNCEHVIGRTNEGRSNKYGAKRTEFNGKIFDSKFEASVAQDLETRKLANDILDYDTQYKVEMDIYRSDGVKALTVNHKVDFRIHHKDGSFELYEAKGVETADYKWRRKLLENLWLPVNKDHTYTVVKQGYRKKQDKTP